MCETLEISHSMSNLIEFDTLFAKQRRFIDISRIPKNMELRNYDYGKLS